MLGAGMAARCGTALAATPRAPVSPAKHAPAHRQPAVRRGGRAPVSPPRATGNSASAAAAAASAEREAASELQPVLMPIGIVCIDNALERGMEYMTAPDAVLAHAVRVIPPPTPPPAAAPASAARVASPAPAKEAVSDTVLLSTRMRWPEAWEDDKKVELFGSWDNWTQGLRMDRCSKGRYALNLTLQPGTYDYKFLVKGEWRVCGEQESASGDDGHLNNRLALVDSRAAVFRWRPEWGEAESVVVCTSADNWVARTPLQRDAPGGAWTVTMPLPAASRVEFKYLLTTKEESKWRAAPGAPAAPGSGNCVLRAEAAVPSVTLSYASGWAAPRLVLPPAEGRGPVEVPLWPAGRGFWRVTLPAGPPGAPALAFTLSDGAAAVDAPPGGGLYRCPHPGGYKLERGRLTPFACALRPRFMVVTDLDGTLVGEGPEADTATAAFRDYWDGRGRLAGGVLVFNTGRSIGQVMSLLKEKAALMPLPDVIVTAVGTKIFRRRVREPQPVQTPVLRPREVPLPAEAGPAPPPAWDEASWEMDADWATALDEGWKLEAARAAAGAVVDELPGVAHWLDKGTEHPHRVSLAVKAEALDAACARLRQGLNDAGCAAKTIVSGSGEWRYVDAVAPRAGKYAATEAVARAAGVPLSRTLAAGDSGNDMDMLSGQCFAIVVGNAQPDLAAWSLAQRQDGRIVHTSAYAAAGLLEGLARHGLY